MSQRLLRGGNPVVLATILSRVLLVRVLTSNTAVVFTMNLHLTQRCLLCSGSRCLNGSPLSIVTAHRSLAVRLKRFPHIGGTVFDDVDDGSFRSGRHSSEGRPPPNPYTPVHLRVVNEATTVGIFFLIMCVGKNFSLHRFSISVQVDDYAPEFSYV